MAEAPTLSAPGDAKRAPQLAAAGAFAEELEVEPEFDPELEPVEAAAGAAAGVGVDPPESPLDVPPSPFDAPARLSVR